MFLTEAEGRRCGCLPVKEGIPLPSADRSRWKRPACWSWYRTGATILSTAMKTGLSDRERKDRLTEAFRSDVFLCSANAITKERGEIYQVDGLSNRIAPLVFGPDMLS